MNQPDILFDSLYVSSGGGMVILKHTVRFFEERFPGRVHYLIDQRAEKEFPAIPDERKTILAASFRNRTAYYRKHAGEYAQTLCFGNIPPPCRLPGKVFVYVANIYYCETPPEFPLKFRLLMILKRWFVRFYRNNADYWVTQNDFMKTAWERRFGIPAERVLVYPVCDFDSLTIPETPPPPRLTGDYIYVTEYTPGKRVEMLIDAWKRLAQKGFHRTLHLTCSRNREHLDALIADAASYGASIVNHGFMPHGELVYLFNACRATVYTSSNESLGLGIVEAIAFGCDVIAPDVPYVYAVCRPSITFDTNSVESLVAAVLTYECEKKPRSEAKLKDESRGLVEFFASSLFREESMKHAK